MIKRISSKKKIQRGGLSMRPKTESRESRVSRRSVIIKNMGLRAEIGRKQIRGLQVSGREKFDRLITDELLVNRENVEVCLDQLAKFIRIRNLRGMRFLSGLPIRGQRTRTNARTCKRHGQSRRQLMHRIKLENNL